MSGDPADLNFLQQAWKTEDGSLSAFHKTCPRVIVGLRKVYN